MHVNENAMQMYIKYHVNEMQMKLKTAPTKRNAYK